MPHVLLGSCKPMAHTAILNIFTANSKICKAKPCDTDIVDFNVAQIHQQLKLAANRVMGKGPLFDPNQAAMAIKQRVRTLSKGLL